LWRTTGSQSCAIAPPVDRVGIVVARESEMKMQNEIEIEMKMKREI
jgi:hypothetical protein